MLKWPRKIEPPINSPIPMITAPQKCPACPPGSRSTLSFNLGTGLVENKSF